MTFIKQHKTSELYTKQENHIQKQKVGRVGIGYEVCSAGERDEQVHSPLMGGL